MLYIILNNVFTIWGFYGMGKNGDWIGFYFILYIIIIIL